MIAGAFIRNNTSAFVRKAGSFILPASFLIWALSYFLGADIEQSYLARAGQTLAPLAS